MPIPRFGVQGKFKPDRHAGHGPSRSHGMAWWHGPASYGRAQVPPREVDCNIASDGALPDPATGSTRIRRTPRSAPNTVPVNKADAASASQVPAPARPPRRDNIFPADRRYNLQPSGIA